MANGINTKDVLAAISDSDIRAFVRQELKRNKVLAIRLATHFIDKVNTEPGSNKYRLLLDQILRVDTSGKMRLTAREAKLLDEVVQKYLKLATAFRTSSEYREAHILLQPLIIKLHQFLDKQPNPDPALVKRLMESYGELTDLVQMPLAPELREAIYSYCMALLKTSYFRIYDVERNALTVMNKVMNELEQPGQLLEAIVLKLSSGHDATYWAVWYYLMRSSVHVYHDTLPSLSLERLHGIASTLHLLGNDSALALCIKDHYDNEGLSPRQRLQWAQWMFDLACRGSDEQLTLEWGLELIRQSGDTNVFSKMVDVFRDVREPEDLVNRILATGDLHLTGLLYASQEQWADLQQFIRDHGALEVLTTHLSEILAYDREGTQVLLPNVLMRYVTHHAGIQCGEAVQDFFDALRNSLAREMAHGLRAQLSEAFPGRFPIIVSGVHFS